ncbi:MAG: ribonuclease H-like domain-containing protein [Lachnospiraceae bacterium]|nr:ribonuclease H-like domain-containing protein [Lachnospiraceae bacterium]
MQKQDIIITRTCPKSFEPGSVILDIHTSTRFWRTSRLLKADLITTSEGNIKEVRLLSEKESDEYDILLTVKRLLADSSRIFTFNGSAFDLPHLNKKYKAYALESPLSGLPHTDLMLELRKYAPLLPLRSHALSDYFSLLDTDATDCGSYSEAFKTLRVLQILNLEDFINGSFTVHGLEIDKEGDIARFHLSCSLPCPIKAETEYFIVHGNGQEAEISVKIIDGNLRLYYADYENYMYLPLEGYSVHKSVAKYIAASRKIPADKGNCFTYIPLDDGFLDNADKIKKYLISLLNAILSAK